MIFDTWEKAFRADDIEAVLTYAADMSDITTDEITEAIDCDGVYYVIQAGTDIDSESSDFINDSQGCIVHSRMFLHTFGKEQKTTFQNAETWLKKIWVTATGSLGPRHVFPFTYQGLIKVWRFHPTGGFRKPNKSGGEFWSVSQPIEFAAETI